MPTQEERINTLEQNVTNLGKGIRDLYYNSTILLGVTSEQGKDIREIKVSLATLGERLDSFEQNVNRRFGTLERNFTGLDQRFGTLEQNFTHLEQSFNRGFDDQDKKFDQILRILNTLVPKSE